MPTGFTDFVESTAATTVRLRMVDGTSPASGLPVMVLDPASRVMARGVTGPDGVVELTLPMAGQGWLVVNDRRGRGTLVRLAVQPGGVNDVGERPLRELTDFPELATLRGVGFEERLTDDPTRTVSTFVLADEGRFAVALLTPVLNGASMQVVAVERASGASRVLREQAEMRNLMAPGRGDWLVWAEGQAGQTTVVFDLKASREVARFDTPSRLTPGGGWRFESALSVLFIDGTSGFSDSDPSPVGVIVDARGTVTQVPLFASTGETWSTLGPNSLWVTNWTSRRFVFFDARTFARGVEQPFALAMTATDECAFVNDRRREGNMLTVRAPDGSSRDLASARGTNWLSMGTAHDGRRLFRSLPFGGAPTTFAIATCEGAQTFELPESQCSSLCTLDATVADQWRLLNTDNESQLLTVWAWPLREGAMPLFRSTSGAGYANYEGGAIPLVTAAPASDPTPQLWLGLPGDGVARTWFRTPRPVWRRPADGRRVVYTMRDPLTEVVQLFQVEVAP
ncbi:MAG: hypothetical protein INH41_31040 [Myxococcaceae bacterium]|nr:hypothetical protein [Myxococcaceae bacterium]MCA3016843.1 hypothetical protein [Myxococcaceae bacterium]